MTGVQNVPIHIIGCGGVGSYIAAALVRMRFGIKEVLHLYDFDSYEAKNIANQYITVAAIDKPKVTALRHELLSINPQSEIRDHREKIIETSVFSGVVFVCVDSMQSRFEIMKSLAGNKHVFCVIETRMDSQTGISHCFDPLNERHCECWWLYWHSDDEAANMAGCGGSTSVVSAVYGVSMLALKQFETFKRVGTTVGQVNRVYQDFDLNFIKTEVWPHS